MDPSHPQQSVNFSQLKKFRLGTLNPPKRFKSSLRYNLHLHPMSNRYGYSDPVLELALDPVRQERSL